MRGGSVGNVLLVLQSALVFWVFCLLGAAILLMKYSAWIDHNAVRADQANSRRCPTTNTASQQPPVATPFGGVPLSGSTALSAADIRDQLSQAQSLLDEASSNVSNALQGVLTWQTDIEPLLEQDVSRPNSEESDRSETEQTSKLYDRLAYVLRRDRPSPQELRDTASKIDSLQLKVRDLMSQSSPLALSLAQMSDISLLHASSVQAKKDWRRDIEQALAIKHLIATQVQTPVRATSTCNGG